MLFVLLYKCPVHKLFRLIIANTAANYPWLCGDSSQSHVSCVEDVSCVSRMIMGHLLWTPERTVTMEQRIIETCMLFMTSSKQWLLGSLPPVAEANLPPVCVGMQPAPHSCVILVNNQTNRFLFDEYMAPASWASYLREWDDGDHMTSETNRKHPRLGSVFTHAVTPPGCRVKKESHTWITPSAGHTIQWRAVSGRLVLMLFGFRCGFRFWLITCCFSL